MTLWDKGTEVDSLALSFSAGNEHLLDERLIPFDCSASVAHARMLGKIGMLEESEVRELERGLGEIVRLHGQGSFRILPEQEDCHTAIEEWLVKEVGEAGKKIHLGRSRNDQVLTALRLYEKDALRKTAALLEGYRHALAERASSLEYVLMPGYTHLRPAMPTTAGTWLGAFADMAGDDQDMIGSVIGMIDRSPLGTGAGYGTPLRGADREMTAEELGFASTQQNPIHTHNCRGKEEGIILSVLSSVSLSLNRLASDLLLFSMPELGFVSLADSLCTGSSIMPHKKNPDLLELVRARYHVMLSLELRARSLVGNLVTGYQRDLGLTKEPVFVGFDTLTGSIDVMARVVKTMSIDEDACMRAMRGELYATHEVYRLAEQGMPFRDAYRRVGRRYVSGSP